jgi:hypothetical protein
VLLAVAPLAVPPLAVVPLAVAPLAVPPLAVPPLADAVAPELPELFPPFEAPPSTD